MPLKHSSISLNAFVSNLFKACLRRPSINHHFNGFGLAPLVNLKLIIGKWLYTPTMYGLIVWAPRRHLGFGRMPDLTTVHGYQAKKVSAMAMEMTIRRTDHPTGQADEKVALKNNT